MTGRQILAAAVIGAIVAAGICLFAVPAWVWHPLGQCTGTNCKGYQFWSGIAGSFATSSGIYTGCVLFYWKHSCHHAGCLRVGLHSHDQHGLLCRKHFVAAGGEIPGKHYQLERNE